MSTSGVQQDLVPSPLRAPVALYQHLLLDMAL